MFYTHTRCFTQHSRHGPAASALGREPAGFVGNTGTGSLAETLHVTVRPVYGSAYFAPSSKRMMASVGVGEEEPALVSA